MDRAQAAARMLGNKAKFFIGYPILKGLSRRTVIVVSGANRLQRILGISPFFQKKHWKQETLTEAEREAALSDPGSFFVCIGSNCVKIRARRFIYATGRKRTNDHRQDR